MIFNASAGTGKTWQVTELYGALVLGGDHPHLPENRSPVPPEKILLMTFTDNAAAELRERVAAKMIAAEESADVDQSDLARSVLRHLPAANISTIHAFCAGLLREHALELGLSPVFQTLEDEERDELLDQVLTAEIFQALETDADFRAFCNGVSVLGGSEYSVIGTIRMLLEKADSRGLDLSSAEAMLPVPAETIGIADFQKIYDELTASGLSQKTVLDAVDALKQCLANFPHGLDGLKKFGRIKAVKHLSDELFELKDRYQTESQYADNFGNFQSFARCLGRCANSFAAAKRARDAVDFGDQLLMVRDLLKSNRVEAPDFEWIIVDEVQDTSRVQCEVIEALWRADSNLVICGDRKQSIYAWRSADPDVMPDLESWMAQRGEYATVPLKKSYRSKDRVIDAVNELFEGLYASYDALEPLGTLQDEKPCVEFLAADDEEQGSDDEMAAVARRIQLLVNGGEEWRPAFGHDGREFSEGTPVRYSDILILLKRSTHQAALEKALRDAGVPSTSGGKGRALFEQQEVRDLLLFLQAVTQPQNDLALVGFLRSPFMNLPDDEIVQLGWDGKTFDRAVLRTQFFETERAKLLLRYREQSGSKLASQLVREVVRETAFDAYLAGQTGGEQMLANFKKALDWLRAIERGGQVLLGDVVRRFERAIKEPPKSGAAEALLPDPQQNAVTIMTVHGAKGLTKRICFVPDISFGEQTDKGFALFSKDSTLELKLGGIDGGDVKSPGWNAARADDKAVREKESVNVFYVAMTRARDLVVLSGAGTSRVAGWMKLSEKFLESADSSVLKRLSYAEIPECETRKLEARNSKDEVVFQPLEIPKGFDRKPVTALVEHLKPTGQSLTPSGDRRAFGTIGHAVLEELAKNRWVGDVVELVELFGNGFEQSKELVDKLEAVREVLEKETAGGEALFAEHPFVLKRDDLILDGSIDLLAQFSNAWKILDYKFSNDTPEHALETYGPQLAAYKEAVGKMHPGDAVSAALVLIGETVQVVEVL
ncbi:UvrD-helicase domain-containing protein [Tichowtungia aerotolerans]|uniref:DNA 3'-5' helicase n=1 Tax=Tichowtungia aerotolerans TaxID=2697043 RepID=A0A6P1M5M8_9BACT|nr:UvrD-helicase domain-containing protein [Tichowtungia aerotolerans]QHI67904.1 UvrD-helicase domain-containing protein [Tichowtungia aerotolerans]